MKGEKEVENGAGGEGGGGGGGKGEGGGGGVDMEQVHQWILDLGQKTAREQALLELSKKREVVGNLPCMLWHSFGTVAALLQEVVSIYPAINPPTLTAQQSNRVCKRSCPDAMHSVPPRNSSSVPSSSYSALPLSLPSHDVSDPPL